MGLAHKMIADRRITPFGCAAKLIIAAIMDLIKGFMYSCCQSSSSALRALAFLCCLLQAWLRSRGPNGTAVYTADTIADQFGVVKCSYDAVPVAVHKAALSLSCAGAGKPQEHTEPVSKILPPALEWGEVLVQMR